MISWLFLGCLNSHISQKEIVISGTTVLPEEDIEAVGTVQLRAYREWSGEDDLRTPLLEIGSEKINALGDFEWRIRVDRNQHEGLVLFGWLDRDNDGVLCDLYGSAEPSGLLVFNWNGVDFSLTANLLFDQQCLSAESLYGDDAFIAAEDNDSGNTDD